MSLAASVVVRVGCSEVKLMVLLSQRSAQPRFRRPCPRYPRRVSSKLWGAKLYGVGALLAFFGTWATSCGGMPEGYGSYQDDDGDGGETASGTTSSGSGTMSFSTSGGGSSSGGAGGQAGSFATSGGGGSGGAAGGP
jgi:hypothetical protein